MEDNNDNPVDNMPERFSNYDSGEFGENMVNSNSIENNKSTVYKDPNYHEILENKIREQAQRLLELQNYKSICERRIKQLAPSHLFPVTETHIIQHKEIENKNNDLEMSYITKQINDFKSLLQLKDQDIMQQMRKYDALEAKYNKIVAESIPKNKVTFIKENKNTFNFPSVEKIPNEKLKEAYSKLHQNMKELIVEKDEILEYFKRETIENEEQKNYIEILKQTIDTTITKLNIGNSLQSQKVHYTDRRNLSNIDLLIDFSKLKNEADKYKKDYLLSNLIINEMKLEIEQYKKANEEMKYKKEKINQTLESGILELEQARNKVINLEEEKEILAQELEGLKQEYENVINDYNLLLKEYEKVKNEYSTCFEGSSKIVEEKNQEIDGLNKKNSDLIGNNIDLKKEIDELTSSKKEDKKTIDELSKSISDVMKEKESLLKENEKLVDKLNEIDKEKDYIKNEYEKLHNSYETDLKKRDDEIDELIKNIEAFNERFSECKKGLYSKDEEIKRLNELILEKEYLVKELNERVEEFEKIDKKFELFQNETNQMLNELNYYKTLSEDYGKTIKTLNDNFKLKDDWSAGMKISNIVNYSQELEQKINLLTKKNEEYNKIIDNYDKEASKSQVRCKNLEDDLETLKGKDKENQKLQNMFNDTKSIISTMLNSAKNFNHKMIINQEPDEKNKNFLETINQFRFSIIQLNNINFLEVLKSLDSWIIIVCNEFEEISNRIKESESFMKERQLKSKTFDKINKVPLNEDNENENRRLKLQVKQLLDEIGFLRSDHEIIRKKYEKLTRETKSSRSDMKMFNEENEKLKNEMSKIKEFNTKLSAESHNFNEEATKLLLKEKQSLDIFIGRITKFIPSREVLKLIKENILNLEQLYQLERDRLKIKQNLYELERSIERKITEREITQEDEFNEKKIQNTEAELSKNIYYEQNNLKSLLKELENKIISKQNTISNIESQLSKIDIPSEDNTHYKEKEEYVEDSRKLKNTGGSNIFRMNYIEKPLSSRKELYISNTERIDSEINRGNKLVPGTNEPPKRIISSSKKVHKGLDNDPQKLGRRDLEINTLYKTNNQNDQKNEILDTQPSKDSKFDHISRKLRSLSNQKQNAFNLNYQLNNLDK